MENINDDEIQPEIIRETIIENEINTTTVSETVTLHPKESFIEQVYAFLMNIIVFLKMYFHFLLDNYNKYNNNMDKSI